MCLKYKLIYKKSMIIPIDISVLNIPSIISIPQLSSLRLEIM